MTMKSACAAIAVLMLAGLASAQEHVSFPTQDGWILHGDLYGTGDRAVARDDANDAGPRLPKIRAHYEKAPDPKELIVVDGSAHAQFLFQTDQGERVMREILRFLSAP